MIRATIAVAAGLAFATMLPAMSAHAITPARDRVFVASYGSDTNPCTFGSPCKTFQQAVNVVAVGGEVTAIDSAGFGPLIISQSVTITSPNGVEAGIVPSSGGNAITINATSDATITLRGLTLEGSGNGQDGVDVTSTGGGTLNIINTVVKDFNQGIFLEPTGGVYSLLMTDVVVSDNGFFGLAIAPTQTASVAGTIKRTTLSDNAMGGASIDGSNTSGNVDMTVADSAVLGGNNAETFNRNGFQVTSVGIVPNTTAYLDNVAVNDFGTGVAAFSKAIVRMARSAITWNGIGVDASQVLSPGAVYTFGDNDITGNLSDVNGTLTPVSRQ